MEKTMTTKKQKQKQKQKEKKMNWDELLPGEILELILSKLPFFNLPNCRLVSKSWNDLVLSCKFDDPKAFFFAQTSSDYSKLHCVDLDHQHLGGIHPLASFSFPPSWSSSFIKILNSVNGLLFCSLRFLGHYFELIYIWNPFTNECIQLNSISDAKTNIDAIYHYGFGFTPKTKQYKIVRYNLVDHRVDVLSFGKTSSSSSSSSTTTSRQWTHLGSMPLILEEDGVYFNGALYWVGSQPHQSPFRNSIFRFDLEHEKFDQVPFPDLPNSYREAGYSYLRYFGVFNETLYLSFYCPPQRVEVWKMEQHPSSSSSSSSWIIAFVVHIPEDVVHHEILDDTTKIYQAYLRIFKTYHLQLIKVCEDGRVLCLYGGFNLILYDPSTRRSQLLAQQDPQMSKHLMVYQIESFNFDPLHKILVGDVD